MPLIVLLVLLLLPAGDALALSITKAEVTPKPETVRTISKPVVPINRKGSDDAHGKATFVVDFAATASYDLQAKLNGQPIPSGAYSSATTEDIAAETTITISVDTVGNLQDGENNFEIFSREGSTTEAFANASTSFTIFVDTQVPNAPASFSAEGADKTVVVSWDVPTSASAVEVVRSYLVTYSETDFSSKSVTEAAKLPSKSVTPTGNLETTLTGLENGTKYYISVRSVDWVSNVSDFPRASTGGAIKTVIAEPVITVSLSELAGEDGGCFIATAAYGSYQEPHVQTLRDFRDRILLRSSWGGSFVKWYYRTSPAYANWIAKHDVARAVVRVALWPVYAGAFLILHPAWLLAAGFLLLGLAGGSFAFRRTVA